MEEQTNKRQHSRAKERDDLLILIIGKLRGLSVDNLNEVNDRIDALTA